VPKQLSTTYDNISTSSSTDEEDDEHSNIGSDFTPEEFFNAQTLGQETVKKGVELPNRVDGAQTPEKRGAQKNAEFAESTQRRELEIREALEAERKIEFQRCVRKRHEWERREKQRKEREKIEREERARWEQQERSRLAEIERKREHDKRERQRVLEAELERLREAEQVRQERERQEHTRIEQEELMRIRLKLEESEKREQETKERLAELERMMKERDERERQLAELQERQRKAEQARQEKEKEERARKQEERRQNQSALQQVGVPVTVRQVNRWGSFGRDGNTRDLTLAILKQMKIIKRCFSKNLPNYTISKIEYIMNDALYNQFNATKAEFRKSGRNTKEMLLFHGTNPQNIDRFLYVKHL